MELTLHSIPLGGEKKPRSEKREQRGKQGFVHSMLSFTRLEIPEVELFETAVTFDPATDPLTAHDALASVFGQKAGFGRFLFRADSASPGRFWVRSIEPWTRWPDHALNALEPRRVVVQLAAGLMYHFSLSVCAGEEFVSATEKRVVPFDTTERVAAWFRDEAAQFGIKPLMLNVALNTMRFAHGEQRFKVPYAMLDGALEVADPDRLRRRVLKGFGYYRRTGLGMLELSN
ncbi:MAG TPA: type I-E CRISPR-associated protein Cas6/Cse3/CasE [Burkholderiaceae bacterium]|nr:type I-E CRISPR-associated protein Cas6/Cse3/CasE [Burkholderiaceae bacterium]